MGDSEPTGFRHVVLRASYISTIVAELFATIQIYAMMNNGMKAYQAEVLHGILLVSILPVVLVHHLASAFIPQKDVSNRVSAIILWADFVFLILELGFMIWILFQGYAIINPLSDRMSPYLVLACYALPLCLLALIILRAGPWIGKGIAKIRASWIGKGIAWIGKGIAWVGKGIGGKGDSTKKKWPGILFGKRMCAEHYEGEKGYIIFCRAALTLVFLIILPLYVARTAIVRPLNSKALVTVRESWSLALPPDFKGIKNARWNVVITNFPDRPFASPQSVEEALQAIAVVKRVNGNVTEICRKGTYINSSTTVPDHISFNCLNATTEEIAQQGPQSGITSATKHFVILVLADYNHTINASVPTMHVRIGLTDDTPAVIKQTRPAILSDHQNMVGGGEVFVRRELTTPWLATLGLSSDWNTYLLTDTNQYYNDPDASTSGYAGPGISSIIMNVENARYGYRVVEDYIEKTVLDGLSAIGGLFGLASTIIALLFGRSISHIVFDSRPLSIFGLFHNFSKVKTVPKAPVPASTDLEEHLIRFLDSDIEKAFKKIPE